MPETGDVEDLKDGEGVGCCHKGSRSCSRLRWRRRLRDAACLAEVIGVVVLVLGVLF